MADYQCWPLWEADSGMVGNIDPESLPLSATTTDALNSWAKRFDSFLNFDSPIESRVVPSKEQQEFDAEARRLWATLQSELGAQFTVVYWENGHAHEPPKA